MRFGGLKLFTDGTLNSRTAFMLEPYADPIPDHPLGTPLMSEREIAGHLRRAQSEGFDVAAHAIGDGAVRRMLDCYEALPEAGGGRAGKGFTLRVEHAQFLDERDAPRFASLSAGEGPGAALAVASLQPSHLLTDVEAIERLVPDRAARAFALRDLWGAAEEAGRSPADLIYLGSDTPVVSPDPNDTLRAAVDRSREGEGDRAIAPEQAVRRADCLSLMRSPGADA